MEIPDDLPKQKPTKRWAWSLLVLVLVIAVAVGYFAYRAKHQSPGSLSRIDQITGKPKETLIGKYVYLNKVAVKTSGSDDIAFWVYDVKRSPNAGRDVLVYLNFDLQSRAHIANNARLRDGQLVSLTGYLKAVPSPDEMQTFWKLSPEDARAAGDRSVYLDAESIDIIR